MASIETLKATVSQGSGLANQYYYDVFLPSMFGLDMSTISILCNTVNLPGRTLATSERRIGMVRRNIVNGFNLEDVSMSFIVLNDARIKKYFEQWQESIINGYELSYFEENVRDINIIQYKKGPTPAAIRASSAPPAQRENSEFSQSSRNAIYRFFGTEAAPNVVGAIEASDRTQEELNKIPTYQVRLLDAYPISISATELGNATGLAEFIQLTVTFTYRDWTSPFTSIQDRSGYFV